MKHKITLAVITAILIFAGSQAKSTYAQTGPAAQNPKGEVAEQRAALNLTAEQKAQLKSIHQITRAQLRALRDDQSLSPEQREAKARAVREGAQQQALGVLTPQQQELAKNRRHEGHGRGPGRAFGREFSRGENGPGTLNLTEDQRAQLKSIHESTRTQVNAIRNDTALTSEQRAEKIKSIHKATRQKLSGILTQEQQDKLREHRGHRPRGEQP
jgi:Spy/CpxP family protein refolding chaperone